jgi:hypothetical protein
MPDRCETGEVCGAGNLTGNANRDLVDAIALRNKNAQYGVSVICSDHGSHYRPASRLSSRLSPRTTDESD